MLCNILPIVGLALIAAFIMMMNPPSFIAVLVGICGFAATMRYLLLEEHRKTISELIGALCGLATIVASCFLV